MSAMLERVARAIAEEIGEDPDAIDPASTILGKKLPFWRRHARTAAAAISAMREPTAEMERRRQQVDDVRQAPALDRYYLIGTDEYGDPIFHASAEPNGEDHGAVKYVRAELIIAVITDMRRAAINLAANGGTGRWSCGVASGQIDRWAGALASALQEGPGE